jgi:predicted metalloprotease with PDZ domain
VICRSTSARLATAALIVLAAAVPCAAQAPVRYRISFPELEHRWMQVEASFADLDAAPFELRMARSSPGRYSLHDFAKNVYDVEVRDGSGELLVVMRPDTHGWRIVKHGGAVTVRYKVFGDRVDGTYLGVDPTHAHINMPAALMWARGLERRAYSVTFDWPSSRKWRVATQLHAGASPHEFTAPNLQYLMDSPVELSAFSMREFTVDGHTFRFAAHHQGTDADLDALVKDVEKIVSQERAVFGEFPQYEPGHYTFIADYLPWAEYDAMEHRNSTVMTSPSSIRNGRLALLDTAAHEFFHGWNIERIRPASLEPFDFDRENVSGELWLGEGFTQYFAPLMLSRAGITNLEATLDTFLNLISTVLDSPGRFVRSAEAMSQMAPFTDGGRPVDRTNWKNTVISYYPFGGAIALALDLTLRQRSGGRTSLDDYMRAMWRVHGKPQAGEEGMVARPYTMDDAEARLAEVSGDSAFAREFVDRFIRGRTELDFARLLANAGLLLRPARAQTAWWGGVDFITHNGRVTIGTTPLSNTPFYLAGLDQGDEVLAIDNERVRSTDAVETILRRHKPGDAVAVTFADRTGESRTVKVTLAADPALELVAMENAGQSPSAEQRAFRAQWLGPRQP